MPYVVFHADTENYVTKEGLFEHCHINKAYRWKTREAVVKAFKGWRCNTTELEKYYDIIPVDDYKFTPSQRKICTIT